MISAIRDDNPVMFMFHKTLQGLGWMDQIDLSIGHVPEEAYTVPLGKANVIKEGTDITIVSLQMTTYHALQAVAELEEAGINAEIIDLRSIVPLDKETILNSVRKTHRLIIVEEDYKSYGIGAEIAAIIAEEAIYDIEAPVKRLAIPDVPIPYSRPLEQFILPSKDKIVEEVIKLVKQ